MPHVEPEVEKLWNALVSELPENELKADLGLWGYRVDKHGPMTHNYLEGTFQVMTADDMPEGKFVLMWFKLSLTTVKGWESSLLSLTVTAGLTSEGNDWKEVHEPHSVIGETFPRARSLEEIVRWRIRDCVFILDDYLAPDPNEE